MRKIEKFKPLREVHREYENKSKKPSTAFGGVTIEQFQAGVRKLGTAIKKKNASVQIHTAPLFSPPVFRIGKRY